MFQPFSESEYEAVRNANSQCETIQGQARGVAKRLEESFTYPHPAYDTAGVGFTSHEMTADVRIASRLGIGRLRLTYAPSATGAIQGRYLVERLEELRVEEQSAWETIWAFRLDERGVLYFDDGSELQFLAEGGVPVGERQTYFRLGLCILRSFLDVGGREPGPYVKDR